MKLDSLSRQAQAQAQPCHVLPMGYLMYPCVMTVLCDAGGCSRLFTVLLVLDCSRLPRLNLALLRPLGGHMLQIGLQRD